MYVHRSDDALRISRYTKNFVRRLGSRGPKQEEKLPVETYVIDTTCAHRAEDLPSAETAQNMGIASNDEDVSIKEKLFDHWGYLWRDAVIRDVRKVLAGENQFDDREPTPSSRVRFQI